MIDCFKHIYLTSDTKRSLNVVCKELHNTKYMDIFDDISEHIIKNKGYIDYNLYKDMRENLWILQTYDKYFDIQSLKFKYRNYNYPLQNISLSFYGFNNIQKITIYNTKLNYVDVRSLINLKHLCLIRCKLYDIDLHHNINLEYLCLRLNKLSYIDLKNNLCIKRLDLSVNQIFAIDITHLKDLKYINLTGNPFIQIKSSTRDIVGYEDMSQLFYWLDVFAVPFIIPIYRLCLFKNTEPLNKKFISEIFIDLIYFFLLFYYIEEISYFELILYRIFYTINRPNF